MTESQRRGAFVVVEGIDGCGSTTHSKRLAKVLRKRGQQVVLTCEPTTGPIGSMIRQVLRNRLLVPDAGGPRPFAWSTMALLFAADRLDHLDSEIVPALNAGHLVISDRYDLSSMAYQSVTSPRGDEVIPWIRQLNACATRPDLTIVIDVPLEVAEARRDNRGSAEELFERREIQRSLADAYAHAERLVPGDRVAHVSGVGSLEVVGERVVAAFDETFGDPAPAERGSPRTRAAKLGG